MYKKIAMAHTRRYFISQSVAALSGFLLLPEIELQNENKLMTVNGWMNADKIGFSLIHEHILVDFIGADKVSASRYNADEVFSIALPKLLDVKEKGCRTLIECTPAYLGRDVKLLKRLSEDSGINIITNTGYYGAVGEKYLPAHAHTETARQLANRWIAEWKSGIDGTGIKPGFIKSSVDKLPFTTTQTKIIEATAITHLATGLTIGIHTGNGDAAMEEKRIIESKGVSPKAWIWIHAQNEKDFSYHTRIGKSGGWVSYDGVHKEGIADCISFLKHMQKENLLNQVLLSQDSGWYNVGQPDGGVYNDYNTIADKLLPAMKEKGFTEKDIYQLFVINPVNAYSLRVKKK